MEKSFSIFSGKYFNQNLICLILAYIGAFFAQKYDFCCLCYISYGLLLWSLFSLFTTIAIYTYEYCMRKIYTAKCHKLRVELSKKIIDNPTEYTNSDENKKKELLVKPSDIIAW